MTALLLSFAEKYSKTYYKQIDGTDKEIEFTIS